MAIADDPTGAQRNILPARQVSLAPVPQLTFQPADPVQGGGGYVPPAPVAQPQVVDRVAYLQQQIEQRRQQAEAEAERIRQAAERAAYVSRVREFTEDFGRSNNPLQMLDEQTEGTPLRYDIPDFIREPAKNLVSESLETGLQGGPLGRGLSEAVQRIPVVGQVEDVRQQIIGKASDTAAEVLVPREVWEVALEFVPGVGSVPDLMRAVKRGQPEAIAALRRAADSPAARQGFEALLRGESGKLRLPGSNKVVTYKELPTSPQILGSPIEAYHGTGSRFTAFDKGLMDQTALYGPGVYMTDDAEIALTYARSRGRRGYNKSGGVPEAIVQTLKPREGLRILNMEKPVPPDVLKLFDEFAAFDNWAKPEMTGAQLNKGLQDSFEYEDLTRFEAGEALESFNAQLQALGYDGIAHVGGIQGGKKHTVTVIFDPKNVEIVTPETRALAIRQRIDAFGRALADETGALVPESVTKMLARRLPKDKVQPPEELAAKWELLPETHKKLITSLADVALSPRERKAIVAARRRTINADLQSIQSGEGTVLEKALAGRGAQQGKIIPAIKPIGDRFDATEVDEIWDGIDAARARFDISAESTTTQPMPSTFS